MSEISHQNHHDSKTKENPIKTAERVINHIWYLMRGYDLKRDTFLIETEQEYEIVEAAHKIFEISQTSRDVNDIDIQSRNSIQKFIKSREVDPVTDDLSSDVFEEIIKVLQKRSI